MNVKRVSSESLHHKQEAKLLRSKVEDNSFTSTSVCVCAFTCVCVVSSHYNWLTRWVISTESWGDVTYLWVNLQPHDVSAWRRPLSVTWTPWYDSSHVTWTNTWKSKVVSVKCLTTDNNIILGFNQKFKHSNVLLVMTWQCLLLWKCHFWRKGSSSRDYFIKTRTNYNILCF